MKTIILLLVSNIFMTIAGYGHLKYKSAPLITVIVLSWLIALPEYIFHVPANRWGTGSLQQPSLKMIQEVITLVVFAIFSVFYLKEPFKWNYW